MMNTGVDIVIDLLKLDRLTVTLFESLKTESLALFCGNA